MSTLPLTDPCKELLERAAAEYLAGNLQRACELAREALACYQAAGVDISAELQELLDKACTGHD